MYTLVISENRSIVTLASSPHVKSHFTPSYIAAYACFFCKDFGFLLLFVRVFVWRHAISLDDSIYRFWWNQVVYRTNFSRMNKHWVWPIKFNRRLAKTYANDVVLCFSINQIGNYQLMMYVCMYSGWWLTSEWTNFLSISIPQDFTQTFCSWCFFYQENFMHTHIAVRLCGILCDDHIIQYKRFAIKRM